MKFKFFLIRLVIVSLSCITKNSKRVSSEGNVGYKEGGKGKKKRKEELEEGGEMKK